MKDRGECHHFKPFGARTNTDGIAPIDEIELASVMGPYGIAAGIRGGDVICGDERLCTAVGKSRGVGAEIEDSGGSGLEGRDGIEEDECFGRDGGGRIVWSGRLEGESGECGCRVQRDGAVRKCELRQQRQRSGFGAICEADRAPGNCECGGGVFAVWGGSLKRLPSGAEELSPPERGERTRPDSVSDGEGRIDREGGEGRMPAEVRQRGNEPVQHAIGSKCMAKIFFGDTDECLRERGDTAP